MEVASITPLVLVPVAVTQAPAFNADVETATFSRIEAAPTETVELLG